MAYTMIAERDNQTVRKQRESALIVLTNALVMQGEGWDVTIVDGDGADFDPRAFEASLAQKFSWYEVKPEPAPPAIAAEDDEFLSEPYETEALVAAALDAEDQEADELESDDLEADELDADELESEEHALHEVDEADFDDEDDFDEADLEDAELDEAEREEAELDELEYEGEPAE